MFAGPFRYPGVEIVPRTKLFCAPDTFIGNLTFVSCAELHMAPGSQIDRFCEISGRGRVILKDRAVVASHCSLLTSSDKPEGRMNDKSAEKDRAVLTGDIVLEEDAYIGGHSIIMPGVTIGRRAVIGAGSYIDKDVPADMKMIPVQEFWVSPRRMREGL